MLKIQTKTTLKNFAGEVLKDETKKEIKLGIVLSNVCGGRVSNITLGWILGKKFATQDVVELKAEEVVFLKTEVEKTEWLNAMMAGQILEILDGK